MSLAAEHSGAFPADPAIRARCDLHDEDVPDPGAGRPADVQRTDRRTLRLGHRGRHCQGPPQRRPGPTTSAAARPLKATAANAGSGSSGRARRAVLRSDDPDRPARRARPESHQGESGPPGPPGPPGRSRAGARGDRAYRRRAYLASLLVSTWIRPSAWSSAATAPAVARVTPRLAPRAARAGCRPPWISAKVGPSWVRPSEVPFPGASRPLVERGHVHSLILCLRLTKSSTSGSRHAVDQAITPEPATPTGNGRLQAIRWPWPTRRPRAAPRCACVVFAVTGSSTRASVVRVPAIKQQTGASSAALGLALLGLSAGAAVATMLLAGALCRRFGSPRIHRDSRAALVSLVLPALARSAGNARAPAGRIGRCLRPPQRRHEQRRRRHGGRAAAPGDAVFYAAGVRWPAGAGLGGLLAPHLSPCGTWSYCAGWPAGQRACRGMAAADRAVLCARS